METKKLDEIRKTVLDQVDQAEKNFKRMPFIIAFIEGALLIAYLCLMDFGDRLHWLILVAALLTYGTLSAGLFTMGTYVNLNTQRVLRAIELAKEKNGELA